MLQGDTSVGSFAGHTIDLRLLLSRWTDVWAVKRGGGISLQVFGRDGSAVHKVYLTDSSNRAGWMQLLEGHIAVDVHDPEIAAFAAPRIGSGCERVLDRMAATGLDASRPAGSARARKVAAGSCRSLLQAVAEARLPIDVVVGNSGCVHTCKGLVATLRVSPPWLVGLGSRGMLRLLRAAMAPTWRRSGGGRPCWMRSRRACRRPVRVLPSAEKRAPPR
jgi:putative hemin transport protein